MNVSDSVYFKCSTSSKARRDLPCYHLFTLIRSPYCFASSIVLSFHLHICSCIQQRFLELNVLNFTPIINIILCAFLSLSPQIFPPYPLLPSDVSPIGMIVIRILLFLCDIGINLFRNPPKFIHATIHNALYRLHAATDDSTTSRHSNPHRTDFILAINALGNKSGKHLQIHHLHLSQASNASSLVYINLINLSPPPSLTWEALYTH